MAAQRIFTSAGNPVGYSWYKQTRCVLLLAISLNILVVLVCKYIFLSENHTRCSTFTEYKVNGFADDDLQKQKAFHLDASSCNDTIPAWKDPFHNQCIRLFRIETDGLYKVKSNFLLKPRQLSLDVLVFQQQIMRMTSFGESNVVLSSIQSLDERESKNNLMAYLLFKHGDLVWVKVDGIHAVTCMSVHNYFHVERIQ